MIKVKIPKKVQVGGHTYKVKVGGKVNVELRASNWRGSHSAIEREIEIADDYPEQDISSTFIHECLHSVNVIYCNGELGEGQVEGIGNGIHQILEGIGIRFVV